MLNFMRIGAIIFILAGLVWTGQGLGLIHGSFMTGSAFWAVMGIVCLLVGAFLAYRAFGPNARRGV